MGSKYYKLKIGNRLDFSWDWKHDFPPVYILPFIEEEIKIRHGKKDSDGDIPLFIRQDVKTSLSNLTNLGLSFKYFEDTWKSFRSFSKGMTLAYLKGMHDGATVTESKNKKNSSQDTHIKDLKHAIWKIEHIKPSEELIAAIELVKSNGWKDWNTQLLGREQSLLPMLPGLPSEYLGVEFIPECLSLGLFLHDGRELYSEIVALFEIFILLNASNIKDPVIFSFASEYINSTEDAKDRYFLAVESVADKVRLYNDTFLALISGQGYLQKRLRKESLRQAWQSLILNGIESSQKGILLENFASLLFTEIEGLIIVEKNLRTQTAELDIVLQNNVARPFWINLGTPLIFVECKNWSKHVDVKEASALESKMRSRGRAVTMSIFLSVSGFTRPFFNHILNLSRDNLLIVAIQGRDIDKLFEDSLFDVTSWLEALMTSQAAGSLKNYQKIKKRSV